MSHIETKTIISKNSYVTKPKPGGGFIAHPSDPGMETIEGATEEETQQRVLEKNKIFLPAILELIALAALFYVILR